MSDRDKTWRFLAANFVRGLFMGTADVVPGISGGTVALLFGIYERLVAAISHFDLTLLGHLRKRSWRQAVLHLDVPFLASLGSGIIVGLLAMMQVMNILLTSDYCRPLTLAAFFGVILASGVIVARGVKLESRGHFIRALGLGLAGALFAFWMTTLHGGGAATDPSYWYIFLCASLAICAMILPGISGAMVLLLMGVYVYLTDIPRNLIHGEDVTRSLVTVLVFGIGCAISLVLFSKLLRRLLTSYHSPTMSMLCGFMFGALPKLWPFQQDLTPQITEVKYKDFRPTWPETFDGYALAVIAVGVTAAVFVVVVECLSRRQSVHSFSRPNTTARCEEAASRG